MFRGIFDEMTTGKSITLILGGLVMLIVWILNGIFTFSYGYDIVGPFLLVDQLGAEASALLSGVVALLFYDAAYTVAFLTLLYGCKSIWQYAVVGLQFVTCLLLSIAASVTAILLLSPLSAYVGESALLASRYGGYGGLVVGFVVNVAAAIGYIAAEPGIAESIKIATRRAADLAFSEKIDGRLRKEIKTKVDQEVDGYIPALVEVKTFEHLRGFLQAQGYEDAHHLARHIMEVKGEGKPKLLSAESEHIPTPNGRIQAAHSPGPLPDEVRPMATPVAQNSHSLDENIAKITQSLRDMPQETFNEKMTAGLRKLGLLDTPQSPEGNISSTKQNAPVNGVADAPLRRDFE